MSKPRFHVRRGDIVEVITGNYRGASGKILQVIPAKQQVIIEGVRMIKKHQRKSQEYPQGTIIEREGPIHVSNVKLVEKASKGEKPAKSTSNAKAKPQKD